MTDQVDAEAIAAGKPPPAWATVAQTPAQEGAQGR